MFPFSSADPNQVRRKHVCDVLLPSSGERSTYSRLCDQEQRVSLISPLVQ